MIQQDDMVVIKRTKNTGYVEKVLDGGDRLMVRIPPSKEWPFPHHVFIDAEKVSKLGRAKPSSEEALF